MTTIPRNHTKKIAALKDQLTVCRYYTLDNGFSAVQTDPSHAWQALDRYQSARLIKDGERYTIRIHGNAWFRLERST